MRAIEGPERPVSSHQPAISRRRKLLALFFGVVFGAYVAQKLQAPLGLGGENKTALFWAFSLAVMALLALLFLAVPMLGRRRGRA
jgi:hypothetical protein